MNETNKLDDDAHEVMNEGRGLCRVLAIGVLLARWSVRLWLSGKTKIKRKAD